MRLLRRSVDEYLLRDARIGVADVVLNVVPRLGSCSLESVSCVLVGTMGVATLGAILRASCRLRLVGLLISASGR
jgi:hypothetical protein